MKFVRGFELHQAMQDEQDVCSYSIVSSMCCSMCCTYQALPACFLPLSCSWPASSKDNVACQHLCLLSYILSTDHSMPEELMLPLSHTCSPPVTPL